MTPLGEQETARNKKTVGPTRRQTGRRGRHVSDKNPSRGESPE